MAERKESLNENLPYWEIRDGVVALSNGQLEVGLEVRIPATTLYGDAGIEALHITLISMLRNGVPQRERLRLMIEATPLRKSILDTYGNYLTSEHPSAQILTEEKLRFLDGMRRDGRLVEFRAYLMCTVSPGRRRKKWTAFSPNEFTQLRVKALEVRQRLAAALDRAGLEPVPLLNQSLFELIWRYFNPGNRLHDAPRYTPPSMHLPEAILKKAPHLAPPTLRSQVASSDLSRRWDYLQFSDYHLKAVSMGSLPVGYTTTGMLSHLLTLPRLYWLVLDYVHEPYGPAVRALMGQARRLYSATGDTGGPTDYADPSVRVGFAETDEALAQISRTGSHVFKMGLTMLILDHDLKGAKEGIQETISAFGQMPGVVPIVESAGLFTQFRALAPLSGGTNERTFATLEENATDFFPMDAPWRGSSKPVSLMWNRWDSLTALDPFDPNNSNWNAIVVGGSGSGKTFLMQSLLGELLRQDVDVMIVDRGYGYKHLVDLFDGQIIAIEPGSVSINPFDLPEGATVPSDEKKAFLMALIRAMIPSEGGVIASIENAIITAAIGQTYARATNERMVDGEVRRYFAGARLSDFVRVLTTLEEIGERSASPNEREIARGLALRLQQWTGDSPFGQFVDKPTTIKAEAPVIYYETTGLDRYPDLRAVGMLLIADLIWKRVERDPSRRKIVVFDEAWAMLAIPEAARFIVELYRRFRRYNAAVYAVTQSLQDFTSPEARGILQNTTYHFLLRLPGEDELVRELFLLPDRALATFRGLSSKKGSYSEVMTWIRREDRVEGDVMVIRPTPTEYWAYTTNANDMVAREKALLEHGGHLLPAIKDLAARYPNGVGGL